MQVVKHFVTGIFSVLNVTAAPMLYRYPYRFSGEALRADWLKIGGDIENVFGKLNEAFPDAKRRT